VLLLILLALAGGIIRYISTKSNEWFQGGAA
jgi:hypothetical protein